MMKTENEKLREVLRCIADLPMDRCSTENDYRLSAAKAIALGALSQQAEPAPAQDDLRSRCAEILEWQNTGVLPGDALRAFAASQPYAADRNHLQMAEADTARQAYRFVVRSGQAEPAPAQDEREAYSKWRISMEPYGFNGVDAFSAGATWQRTRPAQTEQQLVGYACADHIGNYGVIEVFAKAGEYECVVFDKPVYAAPIAQTAPQPEQSGPSSWTDWYGGECPVSPTSVVEYRMRRDAPSIVRTDRAGRLDWTHRGGRIGKSDVVAYRAALSAQGESHE